MDILSIIIGALGLVIAVIPLFTGGIGRTLQSEDMVPVSQEMQAVGHRYWLRSNIMYGGLIVAVFLLMTLALALGYPALVILCFLLILLVMIGVFVAKDILALKDNEKIDARIQTGPESLRGLTTRLDLVFLSILLLMLLASSYGDFVSLFNGSLIEKGSSISTTILGMPLLIAACVVLTVVALWLASGCVWNGYYSAYIRLRTICRVEETVIRLEGYDEPFFPTHYRVRKGYLEMQVVEDGRKKTIRSPEDHILGIEVTIDESIRLVDTIRK